MHDAPVMENLQSLADLNGDAERVIRIERAARFQDFAECAAYRPLECDEQHAGVRQAALVDPRDRAMRARRRRELAGELSHRGNEVGLCRHLVTQDLDSDLATRRAV